LPELGGDGIVGRFVQRFSLSELEGRFFIPSHRLVKPAKAPVDVDVVWIQFGGGDHFFQGFVAVAGVGVKGVHVHGATDEFGARAAEDKVHIHDLHATILHLMGLNHRSLTYLHNGRDERLTENGGRIIDAMLA